MFVYTTLQLFKLFGIKKTMCNVWLYECDYVYAFCVQTVYFLPEWAVLYNWTFTVYVLPVLNASFPILRTYFTAKLLLVFKCIGK